MNPLLAVAQMTSTADVEGNFAIVARLFAQAKARGVDFLCLPENFAFMVKSPQEAQALAEPLDGPLFSRYRALAAQHGIETSFGGFQEREEGRFFNAHVIVGADGTIKGRYHKIHLFAVDLPDGTRANEADQVEAGSDIVCVKSSEVGCLGLSICYDLRFAELYHRLALVGAELLLVPAAFTATTGKAHWEPLLRARAIENQCYVAAASQVGEHHKGRVSHGHAMIVDPWGQVVAECRDGEGLACAEVDLHYLQVVRKQLPVWEQRRPDIFK